VVAGYAKPGPPAEPETEEDAMKMEMGAYYARIRKVSRAVLIAAAKEALLRYPPPAEIVIPVGNEDLEAVGIYPEPPKDRSPRPASLFEPLPEKPGSAADGNKPSAKVGPRAPDRPKNLLDTMMAPPPPPPPTVQQTREPPRSPPIPALMPPKIVTVEVTQPAAAGGK
jgi:hypothetical protein